MPAVEAIFLDTNLLVHAHDRAETTRGPTAAALLTRLLTAGRPMVSMQICSEFFVAVTHKISMPLTHDEAVAEIVRLQALTTIVPLNWRAFEKAIHSLKAYSMSLWDAQIFAVAQQNGATVVLTEDFQHKRDLEGVTFLNPFAADFDIDAVLNG